MDVGSLYGHILGTELNHKRNTLCPLLGPLVTLIFTLADMTSPMGVTNVRGGGLMCQGPKSSGFRAQIL